MKSEQRNTQWGRRTLYLTLEGEPIMAIYETKEQPRGASWLCRIVGAAIIIACGLVTIAESL